MIVRVVVVMVWEEMKDERDGDCDGGDSEGDDVGRNEG